MNIIYLFITLFSLVTFNIAQLSIESSPQSIINISNQNVPIFTTPKLDIQTISSEDITDIENGLPYRFGYSFSVDINFFDYAVCDTLDNGDKIFRLDISSPNAYSLNFIFNNFNLSKGSELFIYNDDYSDQIGAFTYLNNKSYNRFSTTPVSGDKITLEYFEPFGANQISSINISNIIHGYKPVFSDKSRGYGDSQDCNNNVNCAGYQPWIDEKNSVVMTLTDGGTRLCSGTMINNVNEDLELYFLTSQNCLGGHEDWIFMFNYESPTCNNEDGITDNTLSGSILLTHNSQSDFALLKLSENPPLDYNIYFSGWDAREINPSNCVSIHHPVGDIKKLSWHEGSAISDGWFFNDGTHWRIDEWTSGITEPGSYGGPLFNENHHLVGQLHGGESSCDDSFNDYYGKFSKSWNLGLKEWLDPNDTNVLVLDGIAENDNPDPSIFYNLTQNNILIMNNETENAYLTLNNIGEDESILNYQVYNSPFSTIGSLPDLGNYYWIDSKNNSDYDYYWEDITEVGNLVAFDDNDQSAGPFNIGFEFPFYDSNYSEFIINPNGWIGFGDDNTEWDNTSIPSASAPLTSIMAFWDDLNPVNLESSADMSGEVKFFSDEFKLIIWYNNVVHWDDDEPYNFQIIIYKHGLIDINYNNMDGDTRSATIGIQNETGEIGHQVIFNNSYIDDNLRLSFKKSEDSITIDNANLITNSINTQESSNHTIQIDGSLMSDGQYDSYLYIESNATAPIIIPLYIQVGYESIIGDINYDNEINVQDVVLLINIIIGNISPNNEADINQDNQINILDAVLLVGLILEL